MINWAYNLLSFERIIIILKMILMEKTVSIEYYPELIYHITDNSKKRSVSKLKIYPSQKSLKMYSVARFIKRKVRSYNSNFNSKKSEKNIILVKKFTNLKKYRFGKKIELHTFPALVLDHKFLCEIKIIPKNEYAKIVEEFMARI